MLLGEAIVRIQGRTDYLGEVIDSWRAQFLEHFGGQRAKEPRVY